MINNKPFSDQRLKNKQGANEKPVEMSRTNDYTTGNRLFVLSEFINMLI